MEHFLRFSFEAGVHLEALRHHRADLFLQFATWEAKEKLLRLGIRSIVDVTFAISDRDRRRGLRRVQSSAADKHTGRLKSLTVGFSGRHCGCVIASCKLFL